MSATFEKNDYDSQLLQKMVISALQFTSGLYRLISEDDENLFFSPISIYIALALTYSGAEGKTAEELKNNLHLSGTKDDILKGVRLLIDQLKNPHLNTATEIFLEKTYKIKKTYEEAAKKYMGSETQLLDFKNNCTQAEAFINSWVFRETYGKINNLIPRGALDSSTRLVLVNAIHFKNDWDKEFKTRDTYRGDFFVSKQQSVEVQMMTQTDYFNYAQKDTFKVLELFYKDKNFKMILFLPNEIDGLSILEQELFSTSIGDIVKDLRRTKVRVDIPKFKMEKFVDLNESLEKLGIATMFSEDADFSGIYEKDEHPLCVSKVLHKAFVEVDEKGTEAAAATAVPIRLKRALVMDDIFDFNANHPFGFIIFHNNLNLFVGRLRNVI